MPRPRRKPPAETPLLAPRAAPRPAAAAPAAALPVAEARRLAAMLLQDNLCVEAAAGTGKTAILVHRWLRLVLAPEPLAPAEIAALTFTRKAAGEMSARLREALEALAGAAPPGQETKLAWLLPELRGDAELAPNLAERARQALAELGRAEINTIHGFCATLLRLHPAEAGLPPAFVEDDGWQFERHFAERWGLFLRRELGPGAAGAAAWREAFAAGVVPAHLEELARELARETTPLEELAAGFAPAGYAAAVRRLFAETRALVAQRLERNGAENKAGEFAALFLAALAAAETAPLAEAFRMLEEAKAARRGIRPTKNWPKEDNDLLKERLESLLRLDTGIIPALLPRLVEFARDCRASFAAAGHVSFDGLLARARNLLRDNPAIRARCKRRWRTILMDECQDTDPLQYEIALFLAEREGREAPGWETAEPGPGRLFLVGDPKQSIYAFRRADIEAYAGLRRRLGAAGGRELTLSTSFRSRRPVIEFVNELCGGAAPLIAEQENIQPRYVPLAPGPAADAPGPPAGVRLLLAAPAAGESADASAEREAKLLAGWLAREVFAGPGRAAWRDVALLFRSGARAHLLARALAARGIPYVVEGEKTFYQRQEIADFLALAGLLADPADRAALAAFLRSPAGGLTDRELYFVFQGLKQTGQPWPEPGALAGAAGLAAGRREEIGGLFAKLAGLAAQARVRPPAEILTEALDFFGLREVAAAVEGQQVRANLEKLLRLARQHEGDAEMSLAAFAAQLRRWAREEKDEGESPLAEEETDAVRILSVHKAKGLEFEIVVLPQLQTGGKRGDKPLLHWRRGPGGLLAGLRLAGRHSPEWPALQAGHERRQEAEKRRALYVAGTRARRLLVLSACRRHKDLDQDTSLNRLNAFLRLPALDPQAPAADWRPPASPFFEFAELREEPAAGDKPAGALYLAPPAPAALAAAWQRRGQERDKLLAQARFPSPAALAREAREAEEPLEPDDGEEAAAAEPAPAPAPGEAGRWAGTLVHRALQELALGQKARDLAGRLERLAAAEGFRGPALAPALARAGRLLQGLLASPLWPALGQAEELGREVPLFAPAGAGDPRSLEGYIDLLLRENGRVVIVDYKTERLARTGDLPARAEGHRPQLAAYARAVQSALGLQAPPACRLIFLDAPGGPAAGDL